MAEPTLADLLKGNLALPPNANDRLAYSNGSDGTEMRAFHPRDPGEALPGIVGGALERAGVEGRTAMDYGHRLSKLLGSLFPAADTAGHIGARVGDAYANKGAGAALTEAAAYGLPAAAMAGAARAFLPGNRDAGIAQVMQNRAPGMAPSITGGVGNYDGGLYAADRMVQGLKNREAAGKSVSADAIKRAEDAITALQNSSRGLAGQPGMRFNTAHPEVDYIGAPANGLGKFGTWKPRPVE